jgi:hypothetical protein
MVILCPGNNDRDEGRHSFLVGRGCAWSRFEEPGDGWKRKYWKVLEKDEEQLYFDVRREESNHDY